MPEPVITFTHFELVKLIEQVTEAAGNKILERMGLIKSTFTRAEVEKLYSRQMFNKSRMYVKWTKKGRSVICQRNDFENFLIKHNYEIKKPENYYELRG